MQTQCIDGNLKKIVQNDLEQATQILKDLSTNTQSSLNCLESVITRVEDNLLLPNAGLSFLEVKNHLMLNYLIDMTYLMYRKSSGKSIFNNTAVDRLTETRTVLEKMRPIDQKLKYQIEKLNRVVTSKSINPNDPFRFHANPFNLSEKIDENSGSEEEEDEEEKKEGKPKSRAYVPPKLSAVYYGDETKQEQRQRILERAQKRALSSSIMQELRREYDEGPEEIVENNNLHRIKEDRRRKEKTSYEENYMTRLMVTKQDKKSSRIHSMSSLAELSHFEDISALEANPEDFPVKKKKVMKQKSKGKKGKKGLMKRKR